MVAGAAAVRGGVVALSGTLLAAAISLLLWAVTPASGSDAAAAMKAGVAGFAAANLMPVTIGGVVLSVPPLLFTVLVAALLIATARHGRFQPVGRDQESVAVLVTAAGYGLVVAVTSRGFAPDGVVPAGWVWTATALAFVATAGAVLRGPSDWNAWCRSRLLGWQLAAVRAAVIGLCVLVAGGGLALTVAMISHFGAIVDVGALAAPSWTDGLGMALLGVAYVPNAIIAAVGYVSGVGFEIGAGSYSPFGSTGVDLPALPLLAAAPDHAGRSLVGLTLLAIPLIAGYLMARRVAKDLAYRSERVLAGACGALLVGVALGCVSWLARGGVGNGRWSAIGAPPLLVGAVVAVEIAVVAAATAALSGSRTVPWRPVEPSAARTATDGDSTALMDSTHPHPEVGSPADGFADPTELDDDEPDADLAEGSAEVEPDDSQPADQPADAYSADGSAAAGLDDATGPLEAPAAAPVESQPDDEPADARASEGAADGGLTDEPRSALAGPAVTLPQQRRHTEGVSVPSAESEPDEARGVNASAPSEPAPTDRGDQVDAHQHAGRQQ